MRYLKYTIFVFSVFCIVNTSQAEPSSSVQYLMIEPVSMLDWGLYNLKKDLESRNFQNEHLGLGIVDVFYNWDRNRIVIEVYFIGDVSSLEQAKEACKSVVSEIKVCLMISPNSGEPLLNKKSSELYNYFSHEGYQVKTEPEGLDKELDNITEINIMIFTENEKNRVVCKAPLLGTSIMFEE